MLNYILGAGIGAFSAILANRSVAVFNDGFRPIFTEYLSGKMDRKSLATTSFALSIGLILGYGFTNSIALGIIIMHTYLLMGDIIGTMCPESKKGTIISGFLGAIWGVCCLLFMESIYAFFAMLPVNFLDALGSLSQYIVATFALFPALAVTYQFGTKKGVITGAIIAFAYVLLIRFGTFQIGELSLTLNAEGTSMLIGSIVMIFFAVKSKKEASEISLTSIFAENVLRIRKNWPLFALSGGFVAAGTSICIITIGMTAGGMMNQGNFGDAAMFSFVGAIGYIPLVYTTAICTGVFTPASRFILAIGMLVASFGMSTPVTVIVAFIAGAIFASFETILVGAAGRGMDKFPALRDMGDHIRNSMSKILDVALLVGAFNAAGQITALIGMPSLGSIAVMAAWLINKSCKKPLIMPLAVGPIVTIALGIIVNVLAVLGLAIIK